MRTLVEMLKEMGVSDADAEQYIGHLEEALPKYGIADSRLRLAHFFRAHPARVRLSAVRHGEPELPV